MPQLWTETFVSQYFWLMLILLIFYYFIAIKVIPNIANSLKLRQISEASEKTLENFIFINEKSIHLFNFVNKHNFILKQDSINWDTLQNDWLSLHPENDSTYWIETQISEETKLELSQEDDNDISLEEFLQIEEK